MRALGVRPTVRGVAMNPCDHPHGGGEGRNRHLLLTEYMGMINERYPQFKKKVSIVKRKMFKQIK